MEISLSHVLRTPEIPELKTKSAIETQSFKSLHLCTMEREEKKRGVEGFFSNDPHSRVQEMKLTRPQ